MAPLDRSSASSERRPVGWCPACNKTRACIRSQESEMSEANSYSCDRCGGRTHDPPIHLAVPFRDLGIAAEGF